MFPFVQIFNAEVFCFGFVFSLSHSSDSIHVKTKRFIAPILSSLPENILLLLSPITIPWDTLIESMPKVYHGSNLSLAEK